MTFREIPEKEVPGESAIYSSSNSLIGIVRLDDDFHPMGPAQILQLYPEDNPSQTISRAEDARLITIGQVLYIVYSDNRNKVVTEGGFRMRVGELDFDGTSFTIVHTDILDEFEGQHPHIREKNWTPFDYEGNLLLSYSLSPHRVLHPLLYSDKCDTIARTDCQFHWFLGELRGGTAALKINSCQYLGFFHSSIMMPTTHSDGKDVLHYFMGAYLFAAHPPFSITHITQDPIIGKRFYHGEVYEPYWQPVRVVFPCGYIFDESYIWLAYGRQDHEIWICKIDKAGLLRSLEPVSE